MSKPTTGPRYRLELRPLASDVPAAVRLRRFLKSALRGYQLRCTSVEEVIEKESERNPAQEKGRETCKDSGILTTPASTALGSR